MRMDRHADEEHVMFLLRVLIQRRRAREGGWCLNKCVLAQCPRRLFSHPKKVPDKITCEKFKKGLEILKDV